MHFSSGITHAQPPRHPVSSVRSTQSRNRRENRSAHHLLGGPSIPAECTCRSVRRSHESCPSCGHRRNATTGSCRAVSRSRFRYSCRRKRSEMAVQARTAIRQARTGKNLHRDRLSQISRTQPPPPCRNCASSCEMLCRSQSSPCHNSLRHTSALSSPLFVSAPPSFDPTPRQNTSG